MDAGLWHLPLAGQIIILEHLQPEEGVTGESLLSSTQQQYQQLHDLLQSSSPPLCSLGTHYAHAREGLDAAERAVCSNKLDAQSSTCITECVIRTAKVGLCSASTLCFHLPSFDLLQFAMVNSCIGKAKEPRFPAGSAT